MDVCLYSLEEVKFGTPSLSLNIVVSYFRILEGSLKFESSLPHLIIKIKKSRVWHAIDIGTAQLHHGVESLIDTRVKLNHANTERACNPYLKLGFYRNWKYCYRYVFHA